MAFYNRFQSLVGLFINRGLWVCLGLLLISAEVGAQISKKGLPLSMALKMRLQPAFQVPPPSFEALRAADGQQIGGAWRFAVPVALSTATTAGVWTLADGRWVWQLHLIMPEALALSVGLSDWTLPAGAQLFAFSPDGTSIQGAYDVDNQPLNGDFMTGFVKGGAVVLEYIAPLNAPQKLPFSVENLYVAYNPTALSGLDFGQSLSCEININCSEGADFQQIKKGVVRVQVVTTEGVGWCTGSLMNNTAQDGKPFILSAFHCADGFTPNYNLWTFYFNYEHTGCGNSATEPATLSLQGCQIRAGRRETDFVLFELNQRIPLSFSPFFNGWSRDSLTLPTKTAIIHHPQGDVKKISLDTSAAVIEPTAIPWNNNNISPARSHLALTLDRGSIEGGSSGAPFFDNQGRVVAQLHGGYINPTDPCLVSKTFGGWLAKSWDGASSAVRLRDWLDPLSSAPLQLAGTATPILRGQISGTVTTWWGQPLPRVVVFMGTDSVITNAAGQFAFNNVALNAAQTVRFSRPTDPADGIDPVDIILSRRHLLGISTLSNPFSLFAGDIDDNGEIDALDLLQTRRLLLGVIPRFPAVTPWRFVPSSLQNSPDFPFNVQIPNSFEVIFSENTAVFNFIAVKMGDINGTADTNN